MIFNSQICTSREQSERLLALGLKKETADMMFTKGIEDDFIILAFPPQVEQEIPAWSLHRLIEMRLQDHYSCEFHLNDGEDAYEKIIDLIEWQIKEGYFNKEYLEEYL